MKRMKIKGALLALCVAALLTGNSLDAQATGTKDTAKETAKETASQSPEEKSNDATMKTFSLYEGELSPLFTPDHTEYTIYVLPEVKNIAFDAIPNDSKASIAEANGFSDLSEDESEAILTIEAEDSTKITYNFKIVHTEDPKGDAGIKVEEGTIAIPDSDQVVNGTYPEDILPEGCTQKEYNYKGKLVEAAIYEPADLMMLYLTDANGENGAFYIYYSGSDEFMPFIQLKGSDGKFIFPLQYETGIPIPDGFVDTEFSWEGKTIPAYMISEELYKEADTYTDLETEEETLYQVTKPEEFYLLFALSSDGLRGWYLYDTVEGTYQRYLDVPTNTVTDDSTDTAYLNYKEKSQQRMAVICVLAFVIVVLLVVIMNILLRGKDRRIVDENEEDDDDDESDIEDEEAIEDEDDIAKNMDVNDDSEERDDVEEQSEVFSGSDISVSTEMIEETEMAPGIGLEDSDLLSDSNEQEEDSDNRQKDKEKESEERRKAEIAEGIDDDFEFEFIQIERDR